MRQDDDILFRRNLEKSLKYYGLAYNFASNLESSSLNFNIILANNIGMIHYAIGTKEKYERCLQFVLATLMYARSSQEDCMKFDGFFKNTSRILLPGSDQCAAAA